MTFAKKRKKEKKEKVRGQIEPKHLCCGGVLTRFSVAAQQTASRSHISSLFSPKSKGGNGGLVKTHKRFAYAFFLFFFLVGRNEHCALICILMGNKQQLNQLLALCVIFKDESELKTMNPLP